MLFIAVSLLFLFAGAACNPTQSSTARVDPGEIAYKLRSSRLVNVFDVTNQDYSVHDVNYLRGDRIPSEFGGAFEFCSSAEFFCVGSPLVIVVPKRVDGQLSWELEGRRCTATAPFNAAANDITCIYGEATMRFWYSRERGVESYLQVWDGGRYDLVTPEGFFAASGTPDN